MQKTKRISDDGESPALKKKKVQFKNSEKDGKIEKNKFDGKPKKDFKNKKFEGKKDFKKDGLNKNDGKFKKGFQKDGPGGVKKFNKPGFNGKANFQKDKKFSKDSENGEKPKWSEMKKEKKELRLVRRKAKATAEVFEISHKAKLLSAQIQR